MDFKQLLEQQLAQQNSGDRERADYPSSHLKNKELFFPKPVGNTPSSVLIRILPPATPGENYNVALREIFLQARNRNGKDLKLNAVLSPFPNQEDELERALIDWQARNMVPNNYNRAQKASTKYLCNVVQIVQNPQTGQYEEERDPQTGQLVVRMMKIPYSACSALNTKIVDMKYYPQALANVDPSIAQYSFISSAIAYPIQLTKPLKDSGKMAYDVDVFANLPLGALPQGWENLLEDLQYQATPSIEYNKEYVEYFISVVNGTEQVAGQQQAPTQGYQAPQPTQGFTQPVPTQPTQGYTQPAPTQGYAQPVQPVAPTGYPQYANTPVTDPSTISDADMPSNLTSMPDVAPTMPTQAPVAPTMPTQAPVAPTQAPTQATVAPTPVPPVNATPSGLPNIDDLLKGMNPNN